MDLVGFNHTTPRNKRSAKMEIENCLMRLPYGLMHRRRSCCCRRVRACAKSISDGFSGVGSSGFCEQRNVVG